MNCGEMGVGSFWFILLMAVCARLSHSLNNDCANYQTCHDCIRSLHCTWCTQNQTADGGQKCFDRSQRDLCVDPKNHLKKIKDLPLLSTINNTEGQKVVVQVQPQKLEAHLRVKEPVTFVLKYTEAEDYPLDLYYIMDLTKTMTYHKDNLAKLGNLLAKSMKDVTKNFRLGFGSFVDRVVMPYTDTNPENLKRTAPYAFKNHMSLTTDTSRFTAAVKNANLSQNIDHPEGALDAILQAVVCKSEIGWRDKARHLLVLTTDSDFHFAGDGKLGGLVVPNDGECHLVDNVYNSDVQDYPSVSQINSKIQDNFTIIFAVHRKNVKQYESLSKYLDGSSCYANDDSSNIVQIIKDEYKKSASTVQLKDNAPDWVEVKYFSRCMKKGKLKETNKCENLPLDNGAAVEFEVKVQVKYCPEDPLMWNETFRIFPIGIQEAFLEFDLKSICLCPCEIPGKEGFIGSASNCSSHGDSQCGVCKCHEGYRGQFCNCTGTKPSSSDSCRQPKTNGPDCSGHGDCICDKCKCHQRPDPEEEYSGNFCECDNFTCPRSSSNFLLCSGPEHGSCVCGKCECEKGWEGDSCECSTDIQKCTEPGSTKVCSGHGQCGCSAKCSCQENYHGDYCEICESCPSRCEDLMPCVVCATKTSSNNQNCPQNCSGLLTAFSIVPNIEVGKASRETLCTERDERQCYFVFSYSYDDGRNIVLRAKKPDCPKQVAIYIGSIVGSIMLVGIITLLIWKVFTTIQDRREYRRFEEERANAKWSEMDNPMYRKARNSFYNPTWGMK